MINCLDYYHTMWELVLQEDFASWANALASGKVLGYNASGLLLPVERPWNHLPDKKPPPAGRFFVIFALGACVTRPTGLYYICYESLIG